MRVWLAVPFAQRDAAKARGARWDMARRCWYVPDGIDAMLFTQWLPKEWTTFLSAIEQKEGKKRKRRKG